MSQKIISLKKRKNELDNAIQSYLAVFFEQMAFIEYLEIKVELWGDGVLNREIFSFNGVGKGALLDEIFPESWGNSKGGREARLQELCLAADIVAAGLELSSPGIYRIARAEMGSIKGVKVQNIQYTQYY